MKNISFVVFFLCVLYTRDVFSSGCSQTLQLSNPVVSVFQDGNPGYQAIDGNFTTRWSGKAIGATLTVDLGSTKAVCSVRVSWLNSVARTFAFVVGISTDGTTFSQVYSGNSLLNADYQTYSFATKSARYVRLTVNGNTESEWASVNEFGVTGAIDRTKLVPGTYIPGPDTAGLLPGWTANMLTPVYPDDSTGKIRIITGGVYENKIFFGQVQPRSPSNPPIFRNCIFAGHDPAVYTTVWGLVQSYSPEGGQWVAENCLFDASYWMDPILVRPNNAPPTSLSVWRRRTAYTNGIHGGHVTLKHCEMRNVQDGVGFVQKRLTATNDGAFTYLEGCWIHKNVYYWAADWTATNDGSHSDSFQFNTGGNVTLRGNLFGGARNETGYKLYNPSVPGSGPSYNTGDDAWNAAFMIKQEAGNDDLQRIENVLIEKNFIWNGRSGINHAFVDTRPNMFTTTVIRDNYFIRRAGPPGVQYGWYILRHLNFANCYINNRIVDITSNRGFVVGEAVPISRG